MRIRGPICAIAFGVLFANHLPIYGQAEKSQPPAKPNAQVHKAKGQVKIARIKKKPEPVYTKEARKNQIEGTVILHCVFTASGQVTNIQVISWLPDGLTEHAIEAAQNIKFKPAMKDGHPVSMYMELQYHFHLY